MPAVPHKRKEEYLKEVSELGYLKCRPDKLTSQIYATLKNRQYKYLAEYALAGSAFFMPKSERINSECKAFGFKASWGVVTSLTPTRAKRHRNKGLCRNVCRRFCVILSGLPVLVNSRY